MDASSLQSSDGVTGESGKFPARMSIGSGDGTLMLDGIIFYLYYNAVTGISFNRKIRFSNSRFSTHSVLNNVQSYYSVLGWKLSLISPLI